MQTAASAVQAEVDNFLMAQVPLAQQIKGMQVAQVKEILRLVIVAAVVEVLVLSVLLITAEQV